MTDFNLDALFSQVHYAWPFRVMLGDIRDFLDVSEHNIEWQLLVERQSIRRRELDSFRFDDDNLSQSHKDHLIENAEHRFTVALPMQIRYAALQALTNTIEWAARYFQSQWKPPLPNSLRNREVTATLLLQHFATTISLAKDDILADYSNLVVVRNAIAHNAGIVRTYIKPKVLKKAVDDLNGFSIANWHFLGECVQIDQGALESYIDGLSQLLEDIHKAADEAGLLRS
jgi:hypothetical protein